MNFYIFGVMNHNYFFSGVIYEQTQKAQMKE